MIYIASLGYSLHVSNDQNKKNGVRKSAKTNLSGTTSKGNNAIQNSAGLSKADNHNCRKYDDKEKDIEFIRGTNSIVNDVKKLYKDEFVKQVDNTNIEYQRIQKLSVTLEEMDSNLFRSEQQISHLTIVNSNLESENISLNKKLKESKTIIDNLKDENKNLSSKLKYFKDMFYNLVQFLMDKIFRIKDNKYKEFAKELYEHGALDEENYGDVIGISKVNNSKVNRIGIILLFIPIFIFYSFGNFGGQSIGKYMLLYLLGYYLFSDDFIEKLVKHKAIILSLFGVSQMLLVVLYFKYNYYGDLLVNFVGWLGILSCIIIGYLFLNKENKLTDYFKKASFSLYILHQTILVIIGYYVLMVVDNVVLQINIIIFGSLILTILIYEIISRIPITKNIIGVR